MKEADIERVAHAIHAGIHARDDKAAMHALRERAFAFNQAFPIPH